MGRPRDPEEQAHFESRAFMAKNLLKEKRIRNDAVEKKLRNQETAITVVKSSLNQFCKPGLQDLRAVLNKAIKEVNKATAEAYVLANMHVIRMCETQEAVPPLDQSFFYGCLSAVSAGLRQKSTIRDCQFRETVQLYHSCRAELDDYTPPESQYLASGFYQNVSMQMAINTPNATLLVNKPPVWSSPKALSVAQAQP